MLRHQRGLGLHPLNAKGNDTNGIVASFTEPQMKAVIVLVRAAAAGRGLHRGAADDCPDPLAADHLAADHLLADHLVALDRRRPRD